MTDTITQRGAIIKDNNLIFSVDTINKKIGILKTSGSATVDLLGTLNVSGTIMSQGKYVMLQSTDTMSSLVKNFKIVDVNGTKTSSQLAISLQWGFLDIVGTGGNSTFTITSTTMSVAANELAGYYFYIPGTQTNYKITANTATSAGNVILTVTNIDDTSVNLTGINTTSSGYGIIHSNADEYDITATALDGSGNAILAQTVTASTTTNGKIAPNYVNINLTTGSTYMLSIIGKKAQSVLTSQNMIAGSYSKYGTTQNYGSPFVVQHAMLANTGMSLTGTSTATGAKYALQGSAWSYAEQYGFIFSESPIPVATVSAATLNTNAGLPGALATYDTGDVGVKNYGAYGYIKILAYISGQVVGSMTSIDAAPSTYNYDAKTLLGQPAVLAPSILNYRISDIRGCGQHGKLTTQLKRGGRRKGGKNGSLEQGGCVCADVVDRESVLGAHCVSCA